MVLGNLSLQADVTEQDAGYASEAYKVGARELGRHWKVQDKAEAGGGALPEYRAKEAQPQTIECPGAGRARISCGQE